MTNSEPSTIRGIALAPLMNGAQTSARNRTRPSATPRTTPSSDADDEAEDGLLERDAICSPDRALRGAVGEPVDELAQMPLGWREERVDDVAATRSCPATSSDDDEREPDAPADVPATAGAAAGGRRPARRRLARPCGAVGGRAVRSRWVAGCRSAPSAGASAGVRARRPRRAAPPRSAGRARVNSRRQPDLLDTARARQVDLERRLDRGRAGRHHHDLVGERDGLGRGRASRRRRPAPVPRPQVRAARSCMMLAGLHVERAERLVHEQDRRLVDQGLRQRDALAHAAGELVRVAVLEAGQADPPSQSRAAVCASASAGRGSAGRRRRCRGRTATGRRRRSGTCSRRPSGMPGTGSPCDERPRRAEGARGRRRGRGSWTCRSRWARRRRRTALLDGEVEVLDRGVGAAVRRGELLGDVA